MLAAAVAVTLLGVLVMLLIFGQHVNDDIDKRADKIERQFNDIQNEINQRLPPAGAVPTSTPFAAPTPTPSPTETTTPTPSPTESPKPTDTPTPTSTPTIGPEQP
jgi:cytoskeletal protein RodZ